ncbi:hypothetical protein [Chitinolyticbacter meiyuanensis]|uniref:hypothetical protein n=1 Tax=Chitinolyticbacter meiyuanensis TaxID=682798 RepID=UPI0011E5F2DF|nr:hypothetical protein [Chitinolyticbacter meiyuanensis]
MVATVHHPWLITAPWYRWDKAGVPASGKQHLKPAIQKFASDDFVNEFIRDPQHSLVFDNDDVIYNIDYVQVTEGRLPGRLAAFFPTRSDGSPAQPGDAATDLRQTKLVPTSTRKLFLPAHARHYMVVCELHCDTHGLPSVPASEICQAGFVVRRRRLAVPQALSSEGTRLLRDLIAAQAVLADLDETIPVRPNAAKARAARNARLRSRGEFDAKHDAALAEVDTRRQAIADWQHANGIADYVEGWVPGAHKGVGRWQLVEETPQQLTEAWFPLYRVFADPKITDHSASGRALYFGVVPTSAFETTNAGDARFDERSLYEIRTFFRRHDCCCPMAGLNVRAPDCDGALTWSEATPPYRLAPQFDTVGSANRPVTIQMPNLAELAAQALARPIGQLSPIKFVQPQALTPQVEGGAVSGGSMGPGQICHFSIPLITIVALFVLSIFLPIVVFIFQLWFLLAFKFCILPSFKFEGGMLAELSAIPPAVGIDGQLSIDVEAATFEFGGVTYDGDDVRAELLAVAGDNQPQSLPHAIAEAAGHPRELVPGVPNPLHTAEAIKVRDDMDAKLAMGPLIGLAGVLHEQARLAPEPDEASENGSRLDLTGRLKFEPRRISQWKFERHLPTTGEYA